jgi:beta-1,4-glucosyltransferase
MQAANVRSSSPTPISWCNASRCEASLLIHRRRFAENLNGTDFIPYLCTKRARPLRFFLLGARPGIAGRAAQHLVDRLGQQVVGTCDGYAEYADAGEGLVERINASGAEIVLVAFGNPRQETWILDHCDACDAPVMFGVGALLDFLSGNARRAPSWMRTLHLEWLFRLCLEPRRLLKRYTWDMIGFFWICLRAGKQP